MRDEFFDEHWHVLWEALSYEVLDAAVSGTIRCMLALLCPPYPTLPYATTMGEQHSRGSSWPPQHALRRWPGGIAACSFVPRLIVWDGVAEQLRADTHIQDAEDQEWYDSKRLAFRGNSRP